MMWSEENERYREHTPVNLKASKKLYTTATKYVLEMVPEQDPINRIVISAKRKKLHGKL